MYLMSCFCSRLSSKAIRKRETKETCTSKLKSISCNQGTQDQHANRCTEHALWQAQKHEQTIETSFVAQSNARRNRPRRLSRPLRALNLFALTGFAHALFVTCCAKQNKHKRRSEQDKIAGCRLTIRTKTPSQSIYLQSVSEYQSYTQKGRS